MPPEVVKHQQNTVFSRSQDNIWSKFTAFHIKDKALRACQSLDFCYLESDQNRHEFILWVLKFQGITNITIVFQDLGI